MFGPQQHEYSGLCTALAASASGKLFLLRVVIVQPANGLVGEPELLPEAWELEPLYGVGPFRFGQEKHAVVEKLGRPLTADNVLQGYGQHAGQTAADTSSASAPSVPRERNSTLNYLHLGVVCHFFEEVLAAVRGYIGRRAGFTKDLYASADGIITGFPLLPLICQATIRDFLGVPASVREAQAGKSQTRMLWYPALGLRLDFHSESNRLISLRVERPLDGK